MMKKDAESLLRETKAILEGHFLLTSGLHSPLYVEKFNVLQHPEYTEKLCEMIADHFRNQGVQTGNGRHYPVTGDSEAFGDPFYFYGKRKRKNDTSPWLPCGTG